MSVSVIIPVHNCEAYLAEAIESVLSQTGNPVREVVVMDDGSTDRSADIARSYSEVDYLRQDNQGVGAARNRAAAHAKGEFLAFLDADDRWAASKIERQLAGIQEAEMVFSFIQHFKCPRSSQRYTHSPHPMPGVFATTLLVDRKAFLQTGGFPEGMGVGEFIDWYSRAKAMGLREKMIEEVLAYRRVHDNNMTVKKRPAFNEYAKVLKSHLDRKRGKP